MLLPYLNSEPTLQQLLEGHAAIAPHIHRTPVLTCEALNKITGAKLFFKAENFQKVGAFKMRGATRAALALTQEQLSRGLATHSSGNHAQAVARAARLFEVPAYIVMPENAPEVKRQATLGYGARITPCAPTIEARQTTLEEVQAETGATFIHPFDDYNVIAGQATASLELMETVPDLDDIIAPIGGGGLMSGTCLAAHGVATGMRVFGAEPEAVDDAWRSLKSGTLERNESTNTIADGLKTNLSPKTFAIIQAHLQEDLLVTEGQIVEAMQLIWSRMKIIIEPSCAVPLAAILRNPEVFEGRRVGVILTGGNVDLQNLPW
jgi:threonine dehydratase